MEASAQRPASAVGFFRRSARTGVASSIRGSGDQVTRGADAGSAGGDKWEGPATGMTPVSGKAEDGKFSGGKGEKGGFCKPDPIGSERKGMMVSAGSFLFLLFLSISRPDELAAPTPPPILSQGGNFSCVMYTCVNVVYRCGRNPRPVGEVSNRPQAQKLLPPKPTHPARHMTPQGPPKTERPTTGYFQKRRFRSSSNHHLDHRI
jgi:hypothetical protein